MHIRIAVLAVLLAASLAAPAPAVAYGPKGHQMIGAIADKRLSKAARAAVAKNLGYSLRTAANWADCVRDVEKSGSKFVYNPDPRFAGSCKVFGTAIGQDRMLSYAKRNWDQCGAPDATKGCHALYHFADVTTQEDHYDRAFTGTSDHDVVSAINAAIAKLQGKPVPKPFSIKDQAEAILMLAHLVGDLHQPLHVGAVYLDGADKEIDPGPATTPHDKSIETRGGNKLEVGSSSNLHSDWDGVPDAWDPAHIPSGMLRTAKDTPPTPGSIDTWAAAWASESVKASRVAHAGLTFTRTGAKKPGDWVTSFPDRSGYLDEKDKAQALQAALAGARLAAILNSVWP